LLVSNLVVDASRGTTQVTILGDMQSTHVTMASI
jgi:hypothetical protein